MTENNVTPMITPTSIDNDVESFPAGVSSLVELGSCPIDSIRNGML